MSSYVIMAVNKNKHHVSLITKYPMTYDEALKFLEKIENDQERGSFPNTFLTMAEVFK